MSRGRRQRRAQPQAAVAGQREQQRQASARIFETIGPERERVTAVDRVSFVRPMLDPRLKLTPQERGIGNTYGAFYEQSVTGGGSEFLKVYVDTSRTGGGGHSERVAYICRMVDVARAALAAMEPVVYDPGPRRGRRPAAMGRHAAIRPLRLADAMCVNGESLTAVALAHGWWVERVARGRDSGGRGQAVVPDRQRKALAQALREALAVIDSAWAAVGYAAPYDMGTVETE